jgi:hypothetical protein
LVLGLAFQPGLAVTTPVGRSRASPSSRSGRPPRPWVGPLAPFQPWPGHHHTRGPVPWLPFQPGPGHHHTRGPVPGRPLPTRAWPSPHPWISPRTSPSNPGLAITTPVDQSPDVPFQPVWPSPRPWVGPRASLPTLAWPSPRPWVVRWYCRCRWPSCRVRRAPLRGCHLASCPAVAVLALRPSWHRRAAPRHPHHAHPHHAHPRHAHPHRVTSAASTPRTTPPRHRCGRRGGRRGDASASAVRVVLLAPRSARVRDQLLIAVSSRGDEGERGGSGPGAAAPVRMVRSGPSAGGVAGSPRGIAPRGSHGSVRKPLDLHGSSHPTWRNSVVHAQCANSFGSRSVTRCHHRKARVYAVSLLYFFRAQRIR